MPIERHEHRQAPDTGRMQPIFLFGFPRSGTTLLQRVLNSYEDVLIWGEHVGFLRDVAKAYFHVWRNPDFFLGTVPLAQVLEDPRPLTRWQGWMNWIDEDDWRRLYRQFLESVFVPEGLPDKRFWGWKEVHYSGEAMDPTLSFLAEIYPEARYVFLIRSGFNTMASFGIRPRRLQLAEWKHEGCERWRRTVASFWEWHRSGRVESYWIRYEDMIEGEGEVLGLLEAMGKRLGEHQQAILGGQAARGSSFGTNGYNERWKQLSPLRQGVAFACLARLDRELGYPQPPVPIHGRVAGRALGPLLTSMYFGSRMLREIADRLHRRAKAGPASRQYPPADPGRTGEP